MIVITNIKTREVIGDHYYVVEEDPFDLPICEGSYNPYERIDPDKRF